MHGDCREPAAERVTDKERANFCEFFAFGSEDAPQFGGKGGDGARDALEALFRRS